MTCSCIRRSIRDVRRDKLFFSHFHPAFFSVKNKVYLAVKWLPFVFWANLNLLRIEFVLACLMYCLVKVIVNMKWCVKAVSNRPTMFIRFDFLILFLTSDVRSFRLWIMFRSLDPKFRIRWFA